MSIGQKRKTDEKDHEKSQSKAKTSKKPAESSTVVSIEFAAKVDNNKTYYLGIFHNLVNQCQIISDDVIPQRA